MKTLISLILILLPSLSQAFNLNVLVENTNRVSLAGALVEVTTPDGSKVQGITDGKGHASFGNVAAGTFNFYVFANGMEFQSGDVSVSTELSSFTFNVQFDTFNAATDEENSEASIAAIDPQGIVDLDLLVDAFRRDVMTYFDSESACEQANPQWDCDPITVDGQTKYNIARKIPLVDGAHFVSQTVPSTMTAGGTYPVSVTMQNSGTTTWTEASQIRLGSQGPQDNNTWSIHRVQLAAGETIAPGQSKTFSFSIVAPSTVGTYTFQWKMVHDGVAWFGDLSTAATVTVQSPNQVKGNIDGIAGTPGHYYVAGWACTFGINQSIPVHVYLNGPAGVGTFYAAATANIASEVAVSQACGTSGTPHRFTVALESATYSHPNESIYVHGISAVNEPNLLLTNSGTFHVPIVQAPYFLSQSLNISDVDGDAKGDLTVWRSSTGHWYTLYSAANYTTSGEWPFGIAGDSPLSGDFDGDGKTDLVLFRPSNGTWYIAYSSTNYTTSNSYPWGIPNSGDIPIVGDYDGDGKSDLTVWRPSNATWYTAYSRTGYSSASSTAIQMGVTGDIPMSGDYDGDGKTDMAIFRPSTGGWYIAYSSLANAVVFAGTLGANGDTPIAGDYDGDGKTDLAVWKPSTGFWTIKYSSTGATTQFQWGVSTDKPRCMDIDGDGKTDPLVWRPSTAMWYFLSSVANYNQSILKVWGQTGDNTMPKLKP